ncbi:MAG: hypothetical protein FWC77_08560, partial [Defluviitaleaceae bacterium]|nr:hypothetical protein [Defluviitaleaceae bacterium]
MKNTVRKALCIVMVLLFAISANNPVIAGTFNGREAGVANNAINNVANNTINSFEWAEDLLPYEPFYVDMADDWHYIEWTNDPYYDLEWSDVFYYEADEPGEIIWACPDEEEYYTTHGRYLDFLYYMNLAEYEAFRASEMRFAEFLAMRETGLWYCVNHEKWVCPEEYGIIFLWDLPYADELWLEDGEDGSEIWGETIWACPDEEEYYLTHGRLRNLLDYMTLAEYEIFAASGLRLAEFQSLRELMTLTELTVLFMPPMPIEPLAFGFDYPEYPEFYSETISFDDIPISNEPWPEDDETLDIWGETMNAAQQAPSVFLSVGTPQSTSVVLSGTVSNPGGATITARGFIIARGSEVEFSEHTVITTSSTFHFTVTGLTPGTTYRVRAFVRTQGTAGRHLSALETFTTGASVPGQPRNLNTTPGVGQVRVTWNAPLNDGGSRILRYEVAVNNGPWRTAESMSSHTFTGLSSGLHSFWVRAVNAVGPSLAVRIDQSPLGATLILTPGGNWNPTSAAQSRDIQITSNTSWNIASNQQWLTVSRTSGTGNGSFRISVTANTGTQRIGSITITAPNAPMQTIWVTQGQQSNLTIAPNTAWNPAAVASLRDITVTSNTAWIISSNQSWLTVTNVSPASRMGNGSFRINTTTNTGAARSGTITVMTHDGSTVRTIPVTQAAHQATLTLSQTAAWNPSNAAQNRTINVTSNGTWTVSSSNTSWLTVSNISPSNRTGNGSFRINVTANPG